MSDPPPGVDHVKVGNVSMKEFYDVIYASREDACAFGSTHKLVNIYNGWIEAVS